jgi:hypothetical protein
MSRDMDDDYEWMDTGSLRYDTAQICMSGHVINEHYHRYPESNRRFCERCGKKALHQCPACSGEIPGNPMNVHGGFDAPAFCGHCGEAFPWTTASVEAFKQLADDSALDAGDKEQLKATVEDLVRESPKTEVAKERFKRLAKKAGEDFYEAAKTVLINVVSEAARKGIWGP